MGRQRATWNPDVMPKQLYLKVTNDKYELPVAVGDSVIDLARLLGLNRSSLESVFSKVRHGYEGYRMYKIVEVIDDE